MKTNSINWVPVSSHKEIEEGRSEPQRRYMAGYVFDETPDMPDGQKAVEFVKIVDMNHYSAVAVMGTDCSADATDPSADVAEPTKPLDTTHYEVAITVSNSPYGDVILWSHPIKERDKAFMVAYQLAEAIDENDFARVLLYTSLYQFMQTAQTMDPEDNAFAEFDAEHPARWT